MQLVSVVVPHVVQSAAVVTGGVAADGAVGQRRRATDAQAPAVARGAVVVDRGVDDRECAGKDGDAASAARAGVVVRELQPAIEPVPPLELEMAPPVLPAEFPVKPLSSKSR